MVLQHLVMLSLTYRAQTTAYCAYGSEGRTSPPYCGKPQDGYSHGLALRHAAKLWAGEGVRTA
jgi:hypothetical protein